MIFFFNLGTNPFILETHRFHDRDELIALVQIYVHQYSLFFKDYLTALATLPDALYFGEKSKQLQATHIKNFRAKKSIDNYCQLNKK